ncbi:CCC motif membrane protein [Tenacibaculum ascidiaceicola]|uniref:CCC motif membrane protein n=1 Tax=Tenacibaculum ascidiaceicola TaxID=1699411 RepID=UPI0038940306
MEKQKLPNSSTVTVLGVLSILGSCCFGGVLGLILGIVALILAKKAKETYASNPEAYDLGSINTGRIMAIIGIILSLLVLAIVVFMGFYLGWDAIGNPELMNERLQELQ